MRLAPQAELVGPSEDDLLALADAVREAARPTPSRVESSQTVEVGRRGHLRVLRDRDRA
jgi:hypothetical protein